jgi:hypothetical protein
MALNVFPVASSASGGSDTLAKTVSVVSPYTLTYGSGSFSPGTYTITCASSTIATVSFFSNNALIGTAVTAAGTVIFNLGSAADSVSVITNTGSNIPVNIQLTGSAVTTSNSGTLVTLTNSQTYTDTGRAYVVVVGGGQNGGNAGQNTGAAGGASGGITSGIVGLTGSTSVIIGAAGGSTSIGNVVANSGGTGSGAGGFGANGNAGSGTASIVPTYTFVKNGTTGGGGGSGFNIAGSGAGSGIGTGGNGGYFQGSGSGGKDGNSGSGYGAGGGGAGQFGTGGSGTQGVVYLIKF